MVKIIHVPERGIQNIGKPEKEFNVGTNENSTWWKWDIEKRAAKFLYHSPGVAQLKKNINYITVLFSIEAPRIIIITQYMEPSDYQEACLQLHKHSHVNINK